MNKFELSAYGVEEMNNQEMLDTNGGLLGLLVAAVIVVLCASSCVNSPVNIQVGSGNSSKQSTDADSTNVANGSGNGNSGSLK